MRTWATLFPDGSYPVGCECDLLWLSSTPNDLSNWHTSSSLLAVDRDTSVAETCRLPGLVVPDAITVLADRCSYSPTGHIVDDLRARCVQAGCIFVDKIDIINLHSENTRISLESRDGRVIEASRVIVAIGPWLPRSKLMAWSGAISAPTDQESRTLCISVAILVMDVHHRATR